MDSFVEELREVFINEAKEILVELEHDLLALENMPENYELIDNIFRGIHTLKGSSTMFGYENIQNIAHEYESIFNLVRDNQMQISIDLINITLKGIDAFKSILYNDVVDNCFDELIQEIKLFYTPESSNFENQQIDKNSSENKLYGIVLDPDYAIYERGIDPLKIIKEIEESGDAIIKSHNKELPEEIKNDEKVCTNLWEIYFCTSLSISGIEDIFMFLMEEEFTIAEITESVVSEESKYFQYMVSIYENVEAAKTQITNSIDGLSVIVNQAKKEIEPSEIKEPTELNENNSHFMLDQRKTQHENSAWINISSAKIDELLNMVSGLVTSTSVIQNHADRIKDLKLLESIEGVNKLLKQLRINTLELRLVPINTLFIKFKRQVRDLSLELGKDVELLIDTQDTEIDKTILKAIENPLLHIIRNSIDHAIELPEERKKMGKSDTGIIKITSFYSGASVIIQVQDDGRGIDLEKVKNRAIERGYMEKDQDVSEQELLAFIMKPGFSTTDSVGLVSGRGVGMDVVLKELNKVKGSLEIDTEKGLGTSITLKLPVTLSIVDTLMVEVMGSNYLLPLIEVEYCYNEVTDVIYNQEKNCLHYKGNLIPYISLREKFRFPSNDNGNEMVIVINKYEKQYALIVDSVIGEQQTVIKNLGEVFSNQPYFSGGNIMSNGKIALIIDTNHLFNRAYLN